MKYLKTNEEYNKEDLSLIEEEIIQMMYSITDEYQIDSSKDWFGFRNILLNPNTFNNSLVMRFMNIILKNKEEIDIFLNKIIRISNIVKRKFDIDIEVTFSGYKIISYNKPEIIDSENILNNLNKGKVLVSVYFYYKEI